VEFLPCAWLLTVGIPLMHCWIRQTATATPAEPGGLPADARKSRLFRRALRHVL